MREEAASATDGRTAFEDRHSRKDQLRFIACGSVGDGKSTVIGRLLFDRRLAPEDRLTALDADSRQYGRAGAGKVDVALLMDGLSAEREQGITIDVAYRFFETERRRFVAADAPGHERYTRNMASGASNADVALLVVDAREGVRTQTRRHAGILALMGIKEAVLAVNKMDLVSYDEAAFRAIADDFGALADRLGLSEPVCVPLSALRGDNVVERGDAMPWYDGPTLIDCLEDVAVPARGGAAFRFPVQWVNRPDKDFRGVSGTVAGGRVAVGDRVRALPGGRESTVARIVTYDGDPESAAAGDAVTLLLADDIDASRGDILVAANGANSGMVVADQFQAHLVWMDEERLVPGRGYRLRMGTAWAPATVTTIKARIDVDSGDRLAARTLGLNDIGVVTVSLDRPLPIDTFADNPATGGFIMVDRDSNATVAAGMVTHTLRRATNVVWRDLDVDKASRAEAKGQTPKCVWFTGLSGAGKSTVANLLDRRLAAAGKHTYVLDGDNVRHGLNRDLGFTETDRVENIRRIAEVAKLMVDAGLIVLVCAISPFRADREMARSLFDAGEFVEVYVDTPLEVCEARDVKGLYRKARAGEIPNFTGISAPYQPPLDADIVLTSDRDAPDLADRVLKIIL